MSHYELIPFDPSLERSEIVSKIVWNVAEHDNFFTDYEGMCEEKCRDCGKCQKAYGSVARMLSRADALVFEAWRHEEGEAELAGIVYLTHIRLGCDATAHYIFFDAKLRGKTKILEALLDWTFTDHDGWPALQRLTAEFPADSFALGRHAQKRLGFGGPFTYEYKGTEYEVEGVKRNAAKRKGKVVDVVVMGRLNEEKAA